MADNAGMLEWLFRPQCAACGAPEAPFCAPCAASLDPLGVCCEICAQPDVGGRCRRCARDPLPLERVIAPWRFGGQLASAIRRLKFTGAMHVARTLAPLWSPVIAAAREPGAIVVPVPLHWRRRLRRGYDHTWLLALHACAAAGVRPVPALRRIRHAPAQSTLPAHARMRNVAGAFAATCAITGPVVLVDDVVTTGATLAACARALRAAGATSVVGVAIARAE